MAAQLSGRCSLWRGIAIGALGVFAVLILVGAALRGRLEKFLLSDWEDDLGPG